MFSKHTYINFEYFLVQCIYIRAIFQDLNKMPLYYSSNPILQGGYILLVFFFRGFVKKRLYIKNRC